MVLATFLNHKLSEVLGLHLTKILILLGISDFLKIIFIRLVLAVIAAFTEPLFKIITHNFL